jgi:plastocyanin
MKLARILGVIVLGVMLALPWHGIEAGGWASVEIANSPDLIEAGKPVRLDLTVKQHGISPVDIDPLVIVATNADSGDAIEETAAKADGVGKYTVELTFPSDGVWELVGTPGGFPPFDLGPIEIGQLVDTSSITAPAGAVTVTITGGMGSGQFEPGRIEIPKGTLVVWQNDSVEGHTVVLENDPRRSGLIGPGAAFALRFDVPGTYKVSCGPHPAMTATIVVE